MERLVKKYFGQFAEKLLNLSSFTFLNLTQFLGALNDNLFKLIVIFHLNDIFSQKHTDVIQAVATVIFVLPFLLLSAATGSLADRYSKSRIIQLSKVLELVVMGGGVIMFWFFSEQVVAPFVLLFMMAAQSAIFGPSKYGIMPEIVEEEKLSQANGLLSGSTFLAIIFGTSMAAYFTDITQRNFILVGQACVMIAFIGMMTSLYIEPTPAAGSKKKIYPFFWKEIYASLKSSVPIPGLFTIILGSSYFWLIGSYLQLSVIPFGINTLGLTDVQGGYLFVLIALGIGTGSVACGKLSGNKILLGVVPVAGVFIMLNCCLIYLFTPNLIAVSVLIATIGFWGGFFAVPLDSYIQAKSPQNLRGQMLGAVNFLSFVGITLSAFCLVIITRVLGFSESAGFVIMGFLTLLVSLTLAYRLKQHVVFLIATFIPQKREMELSLPEQREGPVLVLKKEASLQELWGLTQALEEPVKFFSVEARPWIERLFFVDELDEKMILKYLTYGSSVCLLGDSDDKLIKKLQEEVINLPILRA